MSRKAPEKAPAFEIRITVHPENSYVGEFYKDGVLVMSTGTPNQYPYVYAVMEPWLAQAPYVEVPKDRA